MTFAVPVSATTGLATKDLVVSMDGSMPTEELLSILCDRLGVDRTGVVVRVERTGALLDPAAPLDPYGIRAGDVFLVGPAAAAVGEDDGTASVAGAPTSGVGLALHAVAGPHLGSWFPLDLGENLVGRQQASVAVALPADEAASRTHACVTVHLDGSTAVSDKASRNGTAVNGRGLGDAAEVAVSVGDRIGVGDSDLVLENVDRTPADASSRGSHLTYGEGSLGFNRQPRIVNPDPSQSVVLSAPPDRPPKRRLPVAAAAVPVVMGAGMFALTKSPMYLLFTLMGPVMAVWSYVDDRRSGRKDFGAKSATYLAQLRVQQREIEVARARAVTWRRTQHPDLATLARWINDTSPQLWNHRVTDPDLLQVRVGTADQPSLVSVRAESGGDDELRQPTDALVAASLLDRDVPVAVDLHALTVFGIVATGDLADGLTRSLTMQIAALHSPREVALVGLAPTAPRFVDWAKWLPHVTVLSDDGTATVAVDETSSRSLFEAITKLADARREAAEQAIGGALRFMPQAVLVVRPPLRIPPKEMAELLAMASHVGICVIWIAPERSELPNECRAILEFDPRQTGATLTFTATGERINGVSVETLTDGQAIALARRLAPLRDVTTGSGAEGIPDRITLPELLDLVPPTPESIARRWEHDPGDLAAPIGAGAFGPVSIDLRTDGPHGLVAGTTGAGKSELIQTLVASLAVAHSPARLTFVFVDYKGGAAFQECVDLPHSLGIVTDLDAHLTRRALVSLNAELRRRERLILEAGAADLRDMTVKAPDRAPPSMLIVVDEFAALRREVPEFVDGVIDIAQRGRSLGIHLLLATQTPKGVVDDKILANTNLRIALRTADADESRNILDRPDAALISRMVPGRGYAKTGPTEVAEFQAAYVGGATNKASETPATASARTFALSAAERQSARDAARSERAAETDLSRIVVAAVGAARAMGIPTQHKPWLPPLRATFPLDALLAAFPPGAERLVLPLGVADAPDQQTQFSWALDLDTLGSTVVFGGPGSGKTTVLRSIALSAAQSFAPDQVQIFALDFGSRGLLGLADLPHCGGVVVSDEIDRVRRLISMLDMLASDRRTLLGSVGAGSTAEYRRSTGATLPEVIVLVDNFAAFWSTMEPLDRSQHVETLVRLIADGKGVGLHFVLSADHRTAVPPAIASTIAGRLVLRLANPEEYSSLGLRELEKAPPSEPGRAFTESGLEIQLGVAGTTEGTDGVQQLAATRAIAAELRERFPDASVPEVRLLPDVLPLAELPPATTGTHRVAIGLEERTLAPAYIDLDADPLFLVCGPAVGGRTNVLAVLARELLAADPQLTPWLLAARKSTLVDSLDWAYCGVGIDQASALAEQLAALAEERAADGWVTPILVVIDDAEELAEGVIATRLDTVQRRARDAGIICVFSALSFKLKRLYAGWVTALRNSRHGIILQPDLETDGDIFGLKLPQRASLRLPEGRGYLITRKGMALVQVALAPEAE